MLRATRASSLPALVRGRGRRALSGFGETDSLERLFENNKRWREGKKLLDPDYFDKTAEITGLAPGEMFVHRNVANLVVANDVSSLAVVQYAVEHLKVKDIIVCGHYGCGGCIHDSEDRLNRMIELNTIEQCINMFKIGLVQRHQVKYGFPRIHGLVYNLKDGELKELDVDFKAYIKKYNSIYKLHSFASEAPPRRSQLQTNMIRTLTEDHDEESGRVSAKYIKRAMLHEPLLFSKSEVDHAVAFAQEGEHDALTVSVEKLVRYYQDPDASSPPPAKRQRRADVSTLGGDQAAGAVASQSLAFHLTRLRGAPDAHNQHAMGLRELLDGAFESVLLSNYMVDVDWLLGECPRLRDVPVLLVHGERDRGAMLTACRALANVTLVAPPLPIAYGTHHAKMLVAVYPEKVRVAIFTANFIAIDWENKTQGVWFQDFGLKTLSDDAEADAVGSAVTVERGPAELDFEADLVAYLSALGARVAAFCKRHVARFDFSGANVALIPSVPGVHKGSDMEKFGHLRVRKLLQLLKVPPSDNPLICQFSSMGSLDEKWLFGEFAQSLLKGKKGITGTSAPVQALHLIWPSVEDVRNSTEGWNAGRAVPCPLKNMKPFLHKYLRKWAPPERLHRKNAMPHIKTYARFEAPTSGRDDDDAAAGTLDWAILTSSNLSKAAWGALQKGDSQFLIRSYELGVLFLPQLLRKTSGSDSSASKLVVLGSKAADRSRAGEAPFVLPLPYSFPLKTYDPKVDEPWVWDLVREDPDVFGNCYLPR
ncbi:hypothetical protein PybrP1_011573 [[Pythium] brassicae (nom. inval.)]|nr:hypothetical protein PybrP1_011573 [[Pythium] brassicae (nom. inval.)]